MCGIAGILSLGSKLNEHDFQEGEQMTSIIRHRGPDSIDTVQDEQAFLGNTRLNIIDLSKNADLPMSNEDKTIWITYNGEVTNFKELKKDFKLEEKHHFQSTSDTEVLIHLYEELGIDFLKHLSGMFAFCLYDKNINKAYVVRDFFGIRPLFYMVKNNLLYFSSEIKSFLEVKAFNYEIDYEAIYHFFSLAYIPDIHTPFKDVHELPDSHLIEIDFHKQTFKVKEYYKLIYRPDYSLKEEATAQQLHKLLLDSVRRNLISDVPVGLTLSGGFDTSTILALTKELGLSNDIHTFSIKINEASFDESYYQQMMTKFAKSIHHEIVVNPQDVMETFITHMAFMDEPSGDGAAIPSFLLAQEAKKYVSVLLSGEGGDEVFNAYETHGAYQARKLYRKYTPAFIRKVIRHLAQHTPTSYKKLSFDFILKRFTEGAEKSTPEAHFFWRHALSDKEKQALMPNFCNYKKTETFFTELFDSLDFDDDLNKLSLIYIKYFFVGDLMVKNDRTIMAHSIEARFPYMDRILVEFVSKIPTSMKIKRAGFNRRYIQKLAMKNYLPKQILNRNNMGLEMPHALWFMNAFKPMTEKYFTKENIEKTDVLSYKAVNQMWKEHMNYKKDHGRSLWCILNFLVWFDLFVDKKNYKTYLKTK